MKHQAADGFRLRAGQAHDGHAALARGDGGGDGGDGVSGGGSGVQGKAPGGPGWRGLASVWGLAAPYRRPQPLPPECAAMVCALPRPRLPLAPVGPALLAVALLLVPVPGHA
ncbi:MAG: hypothetical protein VKP63_06085, partial [Cyanobacteriota bacterium]|nr:hypothetical protein [Cyanobacteriota bacterium]